MKDEARGDFSSWSAAKTADAVRRGEISALEACDAAIGRIEARDGAINAVVLRDFERARAAARRLDAERRPDDPRALLGVPMTVKESNDVAGLPSTWGMEPFARNVAERDATAVARLKAAGAVILGKTNVPPGLADWQSGNPIYGRTVNPHDAGRTPGGSSGGAAAALAAGMVPLELGSDIGGSIRIPAHMCGVFGHKPSFGIVPTTGHRFPGTDGAGIPLAVVGPMARCAADLALALDVMAGPEAGAPYRLDLPRGGAKEPGAIRVLALERHPLAAVDAPVRAAMALLFDGLASRGVTVLRSHEALPDLEAAHSVYGRMLGTVLSRGTPDAGAIDAHAWLDLVDEQMRVTRAWNALFRQVDFVIAPVFGTTAFAHQVEPDWDKRRLVIDGEEAPFGAQIALAGMALLAGLPATAVPIGADAAGLPIAVQVMAAPYQDHAAIGFATLLEAMGLAGAVPAPNAAG